VQALVVRVEDAVEALEKAQLGLQLVEPASRNLSTNSNIRGRSSNLESSSSRRVASSQFTPESSRSSRQKSASSAWPTR